MVDQEITGKNHQIAILGWGSLLWDEENNRHFDRLHGPWMLDGPDLQLEFSRKSQTRSGALTLVIDSKHGAASTVAYAISTRAEPQAAINDLRRREGTVSEKIGRFFGDHSTLNRSKSTKRARCHWCLGERKRSRRGALDRPRGRLRCDRGGAVCTDGRKVQPRPYRKRQGEGGGVRLSRA